MKIVSFSHYPSSTPLHGGQRRVAAIATEARNAGHEFWHVPIYSPHSYPDASADEQATALPVDVLDKLGAPGMREDLDLARVLGASHPMVVSIWAHVLEFEPDVVQFEHPWLYPLFADRLGKLRRSKGAKLIYSSHNVEADLIDPAYREEVLKIERGLALDADRVVAVSARDAAIYDKWRGRSAEKTTIAPNGCWTPDLDPAIAPERPLEEDYAIFAGSAHPPNAKGFWDCIGNFPGFLPPKTALAIVGGVNNLISADKRLERFPHMRDEFFRMMGVVEENALNALFFHSKVICLPVTDGGGTNLKTAEALMWLKPMVAMRSAMRGYEEAESLSGVYVADTAQEFRDMMRRAMMGELTSARRASDVAEYGWQGQLQPLMEIYGGE